MQPNQAPQHDRDHGHNRQPDRRRDLVANLALACVAFALAFGVAELTARRLFPHVTPAPVTDGSLKPWRRVFDETPTGKRLIPNSRVVIRNQLGPHPAVELRINEKGFRDDPIAVPKPAKEFRILALGDSITFAGHLPANASYVERLQYHLNRGAQGPRVEVINAGIGDIGITNEVNVLADPGLSVEPDLVLVGFYLNDSRSSWGFPNEFVNPGWLRRHSVLADTLYRRFMLDHWLERQGEERFAWTRVSDEMAWRSDPEVFREFAELAKYDWGAAWQPDSWPTIDREFARIEGMSREHGFAVMLVVFPVVYQMRAEFVDDEPQRILREKATALGWEFVDLLPRFRELESEALARGNARGILIDACHPTAATYDVVGRLLARRIRPLLRERGPTPETRPAPE